MLYRKESLANIAEGERTLRSLFPDDIWVGFGYFVDKKQELLAYTNEKWSNELIFKDLVKKSPIAGPVFLIDGDAVVEKAWDPSDKFVQHRKTFINTDKGITRVIKNGNRIISMVAGFDSGYYDHKTILNLLIEVFNTHFEYDKIVDKKLFNA